MEASNTALRAPVIIGRGRVGRAFGAAAARSGVSVELRSRDDGLEGLSGRTVLLCVPDAEIAPVAERVGTLGNPALLGHTSGATALDALSGAGAAGTFSIHPLQTVPGPETDLSGCPAAIAGSSPAALEAAGELARMTGMISFQVAEEDRATYHAAASIASNYLVTLEQTAAELLEEIGTTNPRELLEPLIRRSLDNWLASGPLALTGPIARGDEVTVESHRRALAERRPDLVVLYDTLAERTREIAAARSES